MLKSINRHHERLKPGVGPDAQFDHAKEQSRHLNATKKGVEEMTLKKFGDETAATVGGVLQKMELYQSGERAFASFSRESKGDLLDGISAAKGLNYAPIGETMGNNRGGHAENIEYPEVD